MDGKSSILSETLKSIDDTIEKNKAAIKRGEALSRLKNNSDFKLVILDGYIDSLEKKLFTALTNPSGASSYSKEHIMLLLDAVSHFKGYIGTNEYLGTIEVEANRAPIAIEREELYRTEVTADFARNDYGN